uniref:DNA topoisomerase 2 n=1 Tax=Pithovirus LCDPAC01 TaxID=2506600 RepID=A0A481YNJ9_9VIRU|nr:MAG: DNA topoisomerase II [Pithovirus LCDPAC01]
MLEKTDSGKWKMTKTKVMHPEAQERTFLEILGNAGDNAQRSRENKMDPVKIEVRMDKKEIVMRNYGMWIPVEEHESGHAVPELIFGILGTSSNYDPTKKRLYIGMNGLGAKLTNIYSSKFTIECYDPNRQITYIQTWENNMYDRHEPEIYEKNRGKTGITEIRYTLDFKRFHAKEFDEESMKIYAAHCAEVSFTCGLPVYFNKKKIFITSSSEYASMFFGKETKKISYKDPKGMYDICLIDTPDNSIHVSFVNGIITSMGGVHLNEALRVVITSLPSIMKKEHSGISLNKTDVINHVSIILSCRLYNPVFKSQTKEYLVKPKPKIVIPEKLMRNLKTWDLILTLHAVVERKQMNKAKKTDGKRKRRVIIPKATDANYAGKKGSDKCIAILTEGDSAAAYARLLISIIPDGNGRDYHGVLPLQGKPLNAFNSSTMKLIEHKAFCNIKAFMGIKEQVDYKIASNFRKLRYSKIWLMVDADPDGKHIAGLILLFFMCRYRSLITSEMIYLFRTPILRLQKKKRKLKFYTLHSYEKWREATSDWESWTHDYFKGLGTSRPEDIKEDFEEMRVVKLIMDDNAIDTLLKAFDEKKTIQRKRWLGDFIESKLEDIEDLKELNISTFIDNELIVFSMADNIRSIPRIDGFKDALRKVFYTIMKMIKGKIKKVKVAQAAARAADICSYKHGEQCLVKAIASAGQDFVGANNEPFLSPEGIFGTRECGGRDAAKPRYIFVGISWWTKYIYRKEDNRLLVRGKDEGKEIEYECYYPIIPTFFLNFVTGIGTAYSTSIPPIFPLHLVDWILNRLEGNFLPKLVPWHRGFKGKLYKTKNGYVTEGIFWIANNGDIHIDELPVKMWTDKYEVYLQSLVEQNIIDEYTSKSTPNFPRFILHGWKGTTIPTIKALKLSKSFSFNNMTLLIPDDNGLLRPKTFKSKQELMELYFQLRFSKYVQRRVLILQEIKISISSLTERKRFIQGVMDKTILVFKRKRAEVEASLKVMDFKSMKHLDNVSTCHYTTDELAKLDRKISALEHEQKIVTNTTPKDMWKKELLEYMKEFKKRNVGIKPPVYSMKQIHLDEHILTIVYE